jgi:uncharacterized protein
MPNHLQNETSPYLLQHANNPVDWYPWGQEAFDEARRRGVPIFLSVGYATCYWCHVMERESFENEKLAAQLNASFVAIKVDREERPDIDDIYMVATQLMTGRGGWPMSCFLEPEQLRPFWCGTYFPDQPRNGMPSFSQVLTGMASAWKDHRAEVIAQAEKVAQSVREQLATNHAPVPVADPQIQQAIEQLMRSFDRIQGGFGSAPKFPQPVYIEFLLDARENVVEDATRDALDHAVRFTLDRMAVGGMHDQVGGGFHRYSVDATWTVPHFEKMLYDNAQLALVYARAASVYDDDYYRRVVRTTLDYVLREMTDPKDPGAQGFYSAQDAEVDHKEGLNYLWTKGEFKTVLGDDTVWASEVYGLDSGTNFQDPHHPEEPARNVLRLRTRPDALAQAQGITTKEFLERLDKVNAALLKSRNTRKQPITDDKVLAAWNGLMIRALVAGSELLDDPRYQHAALASARFIIEQMHDPQGNLLRSYRARKAHTLAFLEDHGPLIRALVALHQNRPDDGEGGFSALEAAHDLAARAHAAFADDTGTYFDTRKDQSDLFVRARSAYDGAMPSGASMMLHALVDLFRQTPDDETATRAGGLLASLSADIVRSPIGTIHSTDALLRMLIVPDDALHAQVDRVGAADATPSTPPPTKYPVQVFADVEQVEVTPETPGVLQVELRIDDSYHIIAAKPGPGGADLIPLRAGLVSGQGVAVYADYPEGEPYGQGGEIRVHKGIVKFTVALEAAPGVGVDPGNPVLGITVQACTDTECLEPKTFPLDIRIKVKED